MARTALFFFQAFDVIDQILYILPCKAKIRHRRVRVGEPVSQPVPRHPGPAGDNLEGRGGIGGNRAMTDLMTGTAPLPRYGFTGRFIGPERGRQKYRNN